MGIRKTHDEYISELKEKGIQAEPLEPYVNGRTKIPHRWSCGHVTEIRPKYVLDGKGCGRCAKENFSKASAQAREKRRLKAAKEIDQRVMEVHGTRVRRDPKTPYITDRIKISWICDQGHCWEATPTHIKQGYGCPTCRDENFAKASADANARISKLAVMRAYSQLEVKGIQYVPNKNSRNGFPRTMMSKEKWKCQSCGHVWETHLASINYGTGCPTCATSYLKGETFTRELLEEYGIEFQSQKKFSDLKRIKPLSYDFYIPSMDILIECQGEQHYKPVDFMGGAEMFNIQQERDQLKREYARQNGYYLLEISYKDYRKNRILEILKEAGILPDLIVA